VAKRLIGSRCRVRGSDAALPKLFWGGLVFFILHSHRSRVEAASVSPAIVLVVYVIVRPQSTVEYTSVASVFHSKPWSDKLNS